MNRNPKPLLVLAAFSRSYPLDRERHAPLSLGVSTDDLTLTLQPSIAPTVHSRLESIEEPAENRMPEPTYEELRAKLAELEAKQQNSSHITFKVSEKGGVSVYGLGRFPVTLYYQQWLKLLERSNELRAFLEDNKDNLKTRD